MLFEQRVQRQGGIHIGEWELRAVLDFDLVAHHDVCVLHQRVHAEAIHATSLDRYYDLHVGLLSVPLSISELFGHKPCATGETTSRSVAELPGAGDAVLLLREQAPRPRKQTRTGL